MVTVLKLLGLVFAVTTVFLIFAAVFAPGRERLDRKGITPSGWAAIYACIFFVASVTCYCFAVYGGL